ncbi:TraR/DksA family transcriptional regulator [Kaarinaea lacus]
MTAFKKLLQARRRQLLETASISEDAAQTVELDQTRQGRLSRMDALQGQAMSLAAKQRRELELKKIESALARIEGGDFGYCQMCGDEIAVKRLEFDLTAEHCINCAEKLER